MPYNVKSIQLPVQVYRTKISGDGRIQYHTVDRNRLPLAFVRIKHQAIEYPMIASLEFQVYNVVDKNRLLDLSHQEVIGIEFTKLP